MNEVQDALFKKWFDKCYWTDRSFRRETSIWPRRAWEACLKANNIEGRPEIPEGYFKIGEEVEIQVENPHGDTCWVSGTVGAVPYADPFPSICVLKPKEVRRAPAWKPKEGEAVFVYRVAPEVVSVCNVYRDSFDAVSLSGGQNTYDFAEAKPFDPKKIGWSWEAI